MNLERAPGFLVDLRDAVVRGGGAADMTPAVRLQRGPHRDTQTVDLQPTAIDEPGGLHRGRLDDRRLAGLVREPLRHRDIFELASNGPVRRGGATGRERENEERGERTLNAHAGSLSGRPRASQRNSASTGVKSDGAIRATRFLAAETVAILTIAEARRNPTSGDFRSSARCAARCGLVLSRGRSSRRRPGWRCR